MKSTQRPSHQHCLTHCQVVDAHSYPNSTSDWSGIDPFVVSREVMFSWKCEVAASECIKGKQTACNTHPQAFSQRGIRGSLKGK